MISMTSIVPTSQMKWFNQDLKGVLICAHLFSMHKTLCFISSSEKKITEVRKLWLLCDLSLGDVNKCVLTRDKEQTTEHSRIPLKSSLVNRWGYWGYFQEHDSKAVTSLKHPHHHVWWLMNHASPKLLEQPAGSLANWIFSCLWQRHCLYNLGEGLLECCSDSETSWNL